MAKFKFTWVCPKCKHEHSWTWPTVDEPKHRYPVNMNCDSCKASTPMVWAYGRWTEKRA